jgi:hypothetical protein
MGALEVLDRKSGVIVGDDVLKVSFNPAGFRIICSDLFDQSNSFSNMPKNTNSPFLLL